MTHLHPVAAVPNNLITDANLSYTTRRVAFVLLLLAGRKGRYVTVSFAVLARLCRCSTTTAQRAVTELCTQGYLLKSNRYHFILAYDLTPAAFVTLLYLYRCAGRKGRAFPSLNRTAKAGLNMAKSTVCMALKALRLLQAVVRHKCVTRNRCHASSSYYLTNFVFSRNQPPSEGGPKNDKWNMSCFLKHQGLLSVKQTAGPFLVLLNVMQEGDIAGKTRLLKLGETAHIPCVGHRCCDGGIGIGFPEVIFNGIVLLNDKILGDKSLHVSI